MRGLARVGAVVLVVFGLLGAAGGVAWVIFFLIAAMGAGSTAASPDPGVALGGGVAAFILLLGTWPGVASILGGLIMGGMGGSLWILCDVEEHLRGIRTGWRVRASESSVSSETPAANTPLTRRPSRKPWLRKEKKPGTWIAMAFGVLLVLGLGSLYGYGKLLERRNDVRDRARLAESRSRAESARLSSAQPPASTAAPKAPGAEEILTVAISNKRYDPVNLAADQYEDNIWWDATYTATTLQRPARSVKGVLKFCDLFGDPCFQVRMTIDEPLAPAGTVSTPGVGIEYNEFDDDHKWLRTTELRNMTFRFQVETILYADGTTERPGP